ncbi:MAG: glutamate formiminotransferase [Actinomycetota bacterium]|nr:glutamate formiminotransferase [Actinomycetota bacterium]
MRAWSAVLECVVNVSEGRDRPTIAAVAAAGGRAVLDVHTDPHHHRSVLTLAGPGTEVEAAARAVATEAVRRIDIRVHAGVHPRLGAVDVVPFAPLAGATMADALAARNRFAAWAAEILGVPCFLYGPERTLPEIRRGAFAGLLPDRGGPVAHPTAGAMCVGARPVLVAYNVWLAAGVSLATARRVASELRGPAIRALGLDVGGRAQVSMNLVDPGAVGPAEAYDAVAALATVDRAELVGLVPAAVLEAVPAPRWAELDLGPSRTIEATLPG